MRERDKGRTQEQAAACQVPATEAPTQPAEQPTTVPQPTAAPSSPTTPPVAPSKYNEAPQLSEMVARGELPPVEERLPESPAVYPVLEMTGKHGGTIRRGFKGVSDRTGPWKVNGIGLTHFNPDITIRPNLCESWEVSQDAMSYTIHLRKGSKWSDGHPFDAGAITWWYDNVLSSGDLTQSPPDLWSTGSPKVLMQLAALDDYTVGMSFAHPYPMLMEKQTLDQCFAPGHYMSQYHLELVDDKEALLEEVEENQAESWAAYYDTRDQWWANLERPAVTPWLATSPLSGELFVMERNPYFFAVDADGQQLPYVDRITHRLFATPDVFNMWIINGEIDWQGRHVDIANYSLFKENQGKGDYDILLWKTNGGEALFPN